MKSSLHANIIPFVPEAVQPAETSNRLPAVSAVAGPWRRSIESGIYALLALLAVLVIWQCALAAFSFRSGANLERWVAKISESRQNDFAAAKSQPGKTMDFRRQDDIHGQYWPTSYGGSRSTLCNRF
jgi:hypothetical protein